MSIFDADTRRTAASDLEANLVVLAGAGTGKTSLMVERILHHVLERGTPILRLAAITFTEKAASELRERIEEALEAVVTSRARAEELAGRGDEAERVLERLEALAPEMLLGRAREALGSLDEATISTIHGFCSELLRRHPRQAGVDSEFSIDATGEEARALFEELWERFLEQTFGGDGPAENEKTWASLLDKFTVAELEELLEHLCREGFPVETIEAGGAGAREEATLSFLRSLDGEIVEFEQEIVSLDGHNKRLPAKFLRYREAIQTLIECRHQPSSLDFNFGTPPAAGKNIDLSEPEKVKLEERIETLHKRIQKLGELDLDLPAEIGAVFGEFIREYRREFSARGWIGFDGLILRARDLLRDDPAVRREESERLDHLMIDEFQDTDPLQYEIAFFLAGRSTPGESPVPRTPREIELAPGKLFIVGDPKQSIYRFRGADIEACRQTIDLLEEKGAKLLTLTTNFRSVPGLVEPLNDLFEELFRTDPRADPEFQALRAHREPSPVEGPLVEVWSVGEGLKADPRRELEALALAEHLAVEIRQGHCRPGEVAILFRNMGSVDVYLRALQARGIPCLGEGGKGFYERHEVLQLLEFLKILVSPADAVALVGWLRSAAAGVGDDELQRFAVNELGSRESATGPTWSLDLEPDPTRYPRLARALSELRRFRDDHRLRPLDEQARLALRGPLFLALATGHEGTQRLANLERIVERLGQLGRDGKLGGAEIIELVERQDSRLRDSGDSPLADDGVDAVRLLSVHKAKGLEWPRVFLPDLDRKPPNEVFIAPRGFPVPHEGREVLALVLRQGGRETLATSHYREHERVQGEAETRRLLYVAATRAREQLTILTAEGKNTTRAWQTGLKAWGYEYCEPHLEDGPLADSRVFHRSIVEPPAKAEPLSGESSLTSIREAHARWQQDRRSLRECELPRRIRPSAMEPDSQAPDLARGSASPGGEPHGRLIGTAVHLLLEAWNGEDPNWLGKNSEAAARLATRDEPEALESVLDGLRSRLERALENPDSVIHRKTGVRVQSEVPVLYLRDDGCLVEGQIDRLEVSGEGETISARVVDFKTHGGLDDAELDRLSREQVEAYARGVELAIGSGKPAETIVEPLRPDAPPS